MNERVDSSYWKWCFQRILVDILFSTSWSQSLLVHRSSNGELSRLEPRSNVKHEELRDHSNRVNKSHELDIDSTRQMSVICDSRWTNEQLLRYHHVWCWMRVGRPMLWQSLFEALDVASQSRMRMNMDDQSIDQEKKLKKLGLGWFRGDCLYTKTRKIIQTPVFLDDIFFHILCTQHLSNKGDDTMR